MVFRISCKPGPSLPFTQNYFTDIIFACNRTEQHIREFVLQLRITSPTKLNLYSVSLHALSVRLVETPTFIEAPPSAATRIKPPTFTSEVKSQWKEVATVFRGFHELDKRAVEWGRSLLYGTSAEEKSKRSPSSS